MTATRNQADAAAGHAWPIRAALWCPTGSPPASLLEGKAMTAHDLARLHCSDWRVYDFGPLKGKPGCLWDKPCEPDKCSHWPVVEATAHRLAREPKKGGKR